MKGVCAAAPVTAGHVIEVDVWAISGSLLQHQTADCNHVAKVHSESSDASCIVREICGRTGSCKSRVGKCKQCSGDAIE